MDISIMDISNIIPIIFMYAELHYKPKWLWSNYNINEPEILVDTPIRIEPGNDLPIMILIKDAHKYPITLTLESDDVEYLISLLDEFPQDTKEYAIREEILLQTYD